MMHLLLAAQIAVLALAPVSGDPYSVTPQRNQLAALTAQLSRGLEQPTLHLTIVRSPRTCDDAGCALRAGRALHAKTVVFGRVERFTGIRWTAQVSALDVRTGRTLDTLTYGIFGDYDPMLNGIQELGSCLGRSLSGGRRCEEKPPTF